jgi:hypothetical protein
MKEIIDYLEKKKEFNLANQLRLKEEELQNFKKQNDLLKELRSFILKEAKSPYKRDIILSNIVNEVNKKKYL